MKYILSIVFLIIALFSFSQEGNDFEPYVIKGLNTIDESIMPECQSDTFDVINITEKEIEVLPLVPVNIIPDEYTYKCRLLCNKSYNDNFKSIILFCPAIMNSGNSYVLINFKKDTVYARVDLSIVADHELGSSETYTHFINDSTFITHTTYQSMTKYDSEKKPYRADGTINRLYFINKYGFAIIEEEEDIEKSE